MSDGVRELGFYSTKKWIETRDMIKKRDKMICQSCHQPIFGRYIVDHIKPITVDNMNDWNIAYNPDNLQLLCQDCHNKKTFQFKTQPRFNLW